MSDPSTVNHWPDPLSEPEPDAVQQLLTGFWVGLRRLADLLNRGEQLLASEAAATLRLTVIDMMLALNGIQRPAATAHLNSYLSENQRAALERTLVAPDVTVDTWVGQAVALVVIYRWYAPQLVQRFDLLYPEGQEVQTWAELRRTLHNWPAEITTD